MNPARVLNLLISRILLPVLMWILPPVFSLSVRLIYLLIPVQVSVSVGESGTTSSDTTAASFSQQEPVLSDVDVFQDQSDKDSGEEGELSDSEITEKNEEMNYREMVRAGRAFLGWTHIPDFKASAGDTDRSDNPWKGKHPRTEKVSIELPADDWLCYKMEKLNTRAAEGYPSRSQEAAGLKVYQFIRTPKSQSKWYTQSRIRQEGAQRPGKTIFGWSGSEAKLNAQFSRISKVSAYPTSGPASRPVPQKILRRWKNVPRRAHSLLTTPQGLNRCTSEIQEKISQHIFPQETVVKGKGTHKGIEGLPVFHKSVSVALGTAFQHLADSLFIQLANFMFLHRLISGTC